MTIETNNTYILGRKNITEVIVGSKELWDIRTALVTVHIPSIVRTDTSSMMRSWLADNIDKENYLYYEVFCEVWVVFVKEQDAVHFKLRWADGD